MDYKKIVLIGNNSNDKQNLLRYIRGENFREISRSFEVSIYEFIHKNTIISLWNVNEESFFDTFLVGASGIIFLADVFGSYNSETSIQNLKIIDKSLNRCNNIRLVIYIHPKITKRIIEFLPRAETTNIRINLKNPIDFILQ